MRKEILFSLSFLLYVLLCFGHESKVLPLKDSDEEPDPITDFETSKIEQEDDKSEPNIFTTLKAQRINNKQVDDEEDVSSEKKMEEQEKLFKRMQPKYREYLSKPKQHVIEDHDEANESFVSSFSQRTGSKKRSSSSSSSSMSSIFLIKSCEYSPCFDDFKFLTIERTWAPSS
eukprot:c14592_g1_i1.p1 GENE.c14592_g1_i1~~c14592_g1_i1.p1  ORF type:complete len:182 (+),score=65.77 c14592_g1_i1:28-546(+)